MATQVNATRHDSSSGALAKTVTLSTAKSPTRAWKAIAPVTVAVVLALWAGQPAISVNGSSCRNACRFRWIWIPRRRICSLSRDRRSVLVFVGNPEVTNLCLLHPSIASLYHALEAFGPHEPPALIRPGVAGFIKGSKK